MARTYRACHVAVAWFVLIAPDLEDPVSGLEVVQVMFRGGPRASPGYIREVGHQDQPRTRHGPRLRAL